MFSAVHFKDFVVCYCRYICNFDLNLKLMPEKPNQTKHSEKSQSRRSGRLDAWLMAFIRRHNTATMIAILLAYRARYFSSLTFIGSHFEIEPSGDDDRFLLQFRSPSPEGIESNRHRHLLQQTADAILGDGRSEKGHWLANACQRERKRVADKWVVIN